MELALFFAAIILGACIIGGFIMLARRGGNSGQDTGELVRLAEDKARAESELDSVRTELDAAELQLSEARQIEIKCAELERDLANANELGNRVAEEFDATKTERDTLRSEVQKLNAERSGLVAELEASSASVEKGTAEIAELRGQNDKLTEQVNSLTARTTGLNTELNATTTSLEDESSENAQLRNEVAELTKQVNTLTAKVSNLDTELKNSEERLVERGELEKLFGDRFKTMSTETLANQQKQFIDRARETLKPLSDKVEKLDREWVNTSGAFKQQIESLASETRTLSTALTRPQARGQWGEMQVERALELSGLVKGIHYDTQVSDNQGGRTDFIVHMPHRRDIILDSKVSLVALINAQDTSDENERNNHLNQHARHMQEHADSLASKEYWSQLPDSADFVVMVVPEFALPPAVERRPNLIDRALQNNVVISTHSTLVALLKTVAMGWQERQLADEAQEIGKLGRDLHDRLETFAGYYAGMGRALDRAVREYNSGVGSLESRVLTQARRFPELGVQTTKELPESQPVETSVREMRTASTNHHPADDE